VSSRRPQPAATTARSRRDPAPERRFPLVPVLGGVAALVLVLTIVFTYGSGAGELEVGDPTVAGAELPVFPGVGADDPALGLPVPEIAGADWNDTPTAITDDGRAKMIVVLAHWCPFCQEEVPVVQEWIDGGGLPEGVDVYTIASDVRQAAENYPPSDWLEGEGWEPPVILDDEAGSARTSLGLSAYPFWVFVAADGTVAGRHSGVLDAASLDLLAATLVQR